MAHRWSMRGRNPRAAAYRRRAGWDIFSESLQTDSVEPSHGDIDSSWVATPAPRSRRPCSQARCGEEEERTSGTPSQSDADETPAAPFVHLDDVDPVHEDFASRRIDQSVDVTDEGRLAGARKSHDDLNVAAGNRDVDVLQSENVSVLVVSSVLDSPFYRVDEADAVRQIS